MDTLWYKNAIVYSLDVETFMDADGNGIGDFQGLTQCLDYLSGLGITCHVIAIISIWSRIKWQKPETGNS